MAWSRTRLVSRALLGDCLLVHAALRRYPPLPSDVLVAPAICRVAQPAAAKAAASEAAAKALINAGAWWKDARKDAVQAAEVVVGKVLRRRCARCVEGCKGPRRLLVDWRRQRAALSVTAAVPRRSDGQEQEHGLKHTSELVRSVRCGESESRGDVRERACFPNDVRLRNTLLSRTSGS